MLHLSKPSIATFSNHPTFKCRNILETTDHFIMEVKKTGLVTTHDYQWIKISKDQQHVNALNLKYSDSSNHVKELFFEEGYLKFNDQSVIFIEKYNSYQHNYQIRNVDFSNHFNITLGSYL